SSRNLAIICCWALARSRALASWSILVASGWSTGGPSWRWPRSRELTLFLLRKSQPRRETGELTIRPRVPVGEKRVVEPRLRIEWHVQPLDLEQVEQGVQPR